jgi:hypothetical protein
MKKKIKNEKKKKAVFTILTKEEVEAGRCKAYSYLL